MFFGQGILATHLSIFFWSHQLKNNHDQRMLKYVGQGGSVMKEGCLLYFKVWPWM
jgi:cytochrome c oxidase assembly factor CtaG